MLAGPGADGDRPALFFKERESVFCLVFAKVSLICFKRATFSTELKARLLASPGASSQPPVAPSTRRCSA